jgi:hypothetical protein
VLHADVDPRLYPALDFLDRAGEVHGLDVLPRASVRHGLEHALLLFGYGVPAPGLLTQPDEVLVGDDEAFLRP